MALVVFIIWKNKYTLQSPRYAKNSSHSGEKLKVTVEFIVTGLSHSEAVNFLDTWKLFLEISQSNNVGLLSY